MCVNCMPTANTLIYDCLDIEYYVDNHRESSVRMAIAWQYIFYFVLFEGISGVKEIVVPQVGFEPTRPKAEDFESTKSTSSITAAYVIKRSSDFTD